MSRALRTSATWLGTNLLYQAGRSLNREIVNKAMRYGRNYASRGYRRGTRTSTPGRRFKMGRGYARRRVGKTRWRKAIGGTSRSARTRVRSTKFRSQLGLKSGARQSRIHTTTAVSQSGITDKLKNHDRLIKIPWSDNDDEMNKRKGSLCDVIGVKVRTWFEIDPTVAGSLDTPIQVRWAIINPKENTGSSTLLGTDWFVSVNPVVQSDTDFPSTGRAMEYMNRKINRRKFGVLQEGQFTLSNGSLASDPRVLVGTKKFISTYIPVNRQMRWTNNDELTDSENPTQNIYFVWWYVRQGDTNPAKAFGASYPVKHYYENCVYFRNARVLY